MTSPAKIDQWFEAKTQGLTDIARAQLKARWGTMQKVLSSQDRLERIVSDILMDMETRDRLKSGRGNAMLVSGSIYQACKFYELFAKTGLGGKCAIVTSYKPTPANVKGEETGEGATEKLRQYDIYQKMLADWFHEAPEQAVTRIEELEKAVKKKFIEEPGQMKLLIVVDKLLTGFDAPPATYLYIDKALRDHGLFQAICRVNRLGGEDKEYGYIVDYKDLFHSLETSLHDYTSGALDGYDPGDVAGLLEDRLTKAREHLEEARESVRALCEPVEPPRGTEDYVRFFCAQQPGSGEQLKDNEPKRLALYKLTAALVRAYANVANELAEAKYSPTEIAVLQEEVNHAEKVRTEVKLASGDYIDLKVYEPAMRHLIDTYIRAEESEKVSAFDNLSLIQLIVERGAAAVDALPEGIKSSPECSGGNHRKQRPQDHHRRNIHQPQVLRNHVRPAGRAGGTKADAGVGLSGVSGAGGGPCQAGAEPSSEHVLPAGNEHGGSAHAVRQPGQRHGIGGAGGHGHLEEEKGQLAREPHQGKGSQVRHQSGPGR